MPGVSSYPTGYDAFPEMPATLNGTPTHEAAHENVNRAVELIEQQLGLLPRGADATVRARLDRIEEVLYPTETVNAAVTLTGAALTTAVTDVVTMAFGFRGYDRIAVVTVGILLSKSAGTAPAFDLYLTPVAPATGVTRRTRLADIAGVGPAGTMTCWMHIPSGATGGGVKVQVGCANSTATVSTVGSTDLNFVTAAIMPISNYSAL